MAVMPSSPNRSDEQLRLTDTEGDDRRASGFEGGMIGEAAHPQPVIQAMNDAMARPQSAGSLGPGTYDGGLLGVAPRQGEIHRRPGGAGGAVDPGDLTLSRGEIIAKGRMRALALAQHLLVDQGVSGKVSSRRRGGTFFPQAL